MSQDSLTKYFRSFHALQHPVEPVGAIELSEAMGLATYYEARYDDRGSLVIFIKHLRVDEANGAKYVIMFTEEYSYWDSGCIRERRLILPGQADRKWSFKDRERRWSRYFDDICERWFARTSYPSEPTLIEKALLVHEQFTELKISVFASTDNVTHDSEWAVVSVMWVIDQIRRMIAEIKPNASPRIRAVALNDGKLALEGFDDAPFSLFGVVEDWQENSEVPREHDVVTVLPRDGFDREGQAWARGNDIASITVASVHVLDRGQPIELFRLFFWLR